MNDTASPDRNRTPASLFGSPDFLRLWAVGGVASVLRWLEVLAAALFTLDATGSEFAAAAVVAARSLPLLVMGAFAGVVAEALDRKRMLVAGLLLSVAATGTICLLSWGGMLRPWHLFAAGLIGGVVYGTEMPARRRMVGESVAPPLIARAIAADSLTASASRMVGPLIGGIAYQWLGITGAFLSSAVLGLVAAAIALRVRHAQATRRLSSGTVLADLGDGLRLVRATPVLLALLGVTVVQNLFGFAYASLMAPLGRDVFAVSAAMVGVLAAAEPAGATAGGLLLAAFGEPPGRPIWLLAGGAATFLALMAALPLAPWFWAACGLLCAGGCGIALYSNVQTTIALNEAPPAMRSRVLGLITVAIGMWPFGMLLAGGLAERLGALATLGALGLAGLLALSVVAGLLLRAGLLMPRAPAPARARGRPPSRRS